MSNSTAANVLINPGQAFWVKRLTVTAQSNAVFTGYAHTNAYALTFPTNTWTLFSWPFSRRFEGDGTNLGWGFAAAGAYEGYNWATGDRINGQYTNANFMIYLVTDGSWRVAGTTNIANVALVAGGGYRYFRQPVATNSLTWTPPSQ